ncbi:serine/arginine repetitive matrix protein 1 [Triticum aestivum]|uniref:serine/arginine repetitive matrix protein 1 n=1 Tax=Triticum aestivum TaxID=4565 RepID=UPI001D00CC6F|nr:serine/arginine repetitive matrix protein 1-like [Triticum aestivum]
MPTNRKRKPPNADPIARNLLPRPRSLSPATPQPPVRRRATASAVAGHLLPPLQPHTTLSHRSGHRPASPAGATITAHCCPSPACRTAPPLPAGSRRPSPPTKRSPSSAACHHLSTPASRHLDRVSIGHPRCRPPPRSCSQTTCSAAPPSLPYAPTTSLPHAPNLPSGVTFRPLRRDLPFPPMRPALCSGAMHASRSYSSERMGSKTRCVVGGGQDGGMELVSWYG